MSIRHESGAHPRQVLRAASLVGAAILSGGSLQAGVLIVDASGGGDHTTIQAAVDAAAEGDVILVRPGGWYGETEILSKSVHVVGLGDHVNLRSLRVRILSPDQDVGISGLVIGTVRIAACEGSVRIQDCEVFGDDGDASAVALHATDCLDVVLTDSEFTGGEGYDDDDGDPTGLPGMVALRSSIVIHRSTIRGGRGASSCNESRTYGGGGAGGPGIEATHSFLFFESGLVEGGQGGDGMFDGTWCCYDGPGGDGTRLSFQSAAHATNAFLSRPGGSGGSHCSDWYDPGEDLVVDGSSSYQTWNELQRTISVPAAAESTDQVQLVVRGNPGDKVWFPRGYHGRHVFSMVAGGVLQLHQQIPGSHLLLGVVPASGILTKTISASNLAMGLIDQSVHYQLYVRDSAGFRRVGESGFVSVVSVPLH